MHFVYLVRCADDTLYTGYTTDVERRLAEHNDGIASKYTRGRLPVKLEHVEAYDDQSTAQRREYEIKQLPRTRKEKLIDDENREPRDAMGEKRADQ